MTPLESRLAVELRPVPGGWQVRLRLRRPVAACRLLEGRTGPEALSLIPRLYGICGHTHRQAAGLALAAAGALSDQGDAARRRAALARLESVREHLLGILGTWPRLLRLQPAAAVPGEAAEAVARTQALMEAPEAGLQTLRAWVSERVFGRPAAEFLALDASSLERWWRAGATEAARLLSRAARYALARAGETPQLPRECARVLGAELAGPQWSAFVSRPVWQDEPAENSVASAWTGHPLIRELRRRRPEAFLLHRFTARLLELARQLESPTGDEPARVTRPAPGTALAEVPSPRGRLFHYAACTQGRVDRYRILAPTEWNFHPRGPAVQALKGIPADSPGEARMLAEAVIHALDPCVAFTVAVEGPMEMRRAGHA